MLNLAPSTLVLYSFTGLVLLILVGNRRQNAKVSCFQTVVELRRSLLGKAPVHPDLGTDSPILVFLQRVSILPRW
jgi:hypothetical protein